MMRAPEWTANGRADLPCLRVLEPSHDRCDNSFEVHSMNLCYRNKVPSPAF